MPTLALLLVLLLLTSCRQSAQQPPPPDPNAPRLSLTIDPNPPVVGDAALLVALVNADGVPIDGARIEVRGDMTHAGMQPVTGATAESEAGIYRVPFRWTMGGDWIITVTAALPDGTRVTDSFDLSVAS